MSGAKQTSPGVPLYNQNLTTNSSGILDLPNLTWDTYSITPMDSTHAITGITPLSPLVLNPGNAQNVQLVVVPKQLDALMITVVDNATLLPLSNATVHLSASGVDQTLITGQGYMNQVDWSAGSGQSIDIGGCGVTH